VEKTQLEHQAARKLYFGVLASGVVLLGLLWWSIPAPSHRPRAPVAAAPRLKKVQYRIPLPPAGLAPGAVVMASFPDAGISKSGKRLPSPDGSCQIEFEVPDSVGSAGPAELWVDTPKGSYRWHNTGSALQLSDQQVGSPRQPESYRYPPVTAKAPKADPKMPQLPPGMKLPPAVKLRDADEVRALAEKYRAPK